jgi:hypothetical protein
VRLEPIQKPKGLRMRIAYWMTRRELGKVMTPMKVVYPRIPERAALAKRVCDATFEALRQHLSEREIVEITWLNSHGFCAIAPARTA